jgi:hypothetical protein
MAAQVILNINKKTGYSKWKQHLNTALNWILALVFKQVVFEHMRR